MRTTIPLLAALLLLPACPDPEAPPVPSDRVFERWEADTGYGRWRLEEAPLPGICAGTKVYEDPAWVDTAWTLTRTADRIESIHDDNGDGTPDGHQVAELDERGEPLRFISDDSGNDVQVFDETWSYDAQGRRLSMLSVLDGQRTSVRTWKYDGDRGTMDRDDGEDGTVDQHRNYIFDAKRRKLHEDIDGFPFAESVDGMFELAIDYEWMGDRVVVEIIQDGAANGRATTTRYIYDQEGRQTRLEHLTPEGELWSSDDYIHDEQGRLIRIEHHAYPLDAGDSNFTVTYEYDCA